MKGEYILDTLCIYLKLSKMKPSVEKRINRLLRKGREEGKIV